MVRTCRHARGVRKCSRDCCQGDGISPTSGAEALAGYRDEFMYELYSPDLHSGSSAPLLDQPRWTCVPNFSGLQRGQKLVRIFGHMSLTLTHWN